jgi:hypothetical protein
MLGDAGEAPDQVDEVGGAGHRRPMSVATTTATTSGPSMEETTPSAGSQERLRAVSEGNPHKVVISIPDADARQPRGQDRSMGVPLTGPVDAATPGRNTRRSITRRHQHHAPMRSSRTRSVADAEIRAWRRRAPAYPLVLRRILRGPRVQGAELSRPRLGGARTSD